VTDLTRAAMAPNLAALEAPSTL